MKSQFKSREVHDLLVDLHLKLTHGINWPYGLAAANYFLKWLSNLISIKRSDTLTATLGNDSGSIFYILYLVFLKQAIIFL